MIKCRIDEIFKRNEYNITEFCKYVGITRAAYYNILSSSADPKVTTAIKITKYLNENVKDMLDWYVEDLWEVIEEKLPEDDQIPGQMTLEEYQEKLDPTCINKGTKLINAKPRKKAT